MQVEVCVNMRKQCGTDDTNHWCQQLLPRVCRCRVAKEPTPKLRTYMSHATAARPLEIVAMDFTQLEKSTSAGIIENVLVITDVFTKYTITIPTRDQTAKTVSRLIVREWIPKLCVPTQRPRQVFWKPNDQTIMFVISSKDVKNDTLPSSGKWASRTISS